ncbi:dihydrofolate reductase family protein [Streptomyces sp. RFCAC02]|uniref:dihydrofolate reductase family protein n=1 Tax=Streptomyces sp. RFCAC02 TaxID=2499143 RepID=UPI00101EB2F1|nr:dihydrofolate reductase family protein [Streptomyces sp. RFCAC02]
MTTPDLPSVLLSVAMSVDGRIDDATPDRLVLSGADDLDRVDEVRAAHDAILVGAGTIRADDPRLLVRSAARRRARVAAGLPENPLKAALSGSGDLDPAAAFFTAGPADRVVYCPTPAVPRARARLGGAAPVVDGGDPFDLARVLADLRGRGVRRLMVEGGATVHTRFLEAGLVDELHLVIAPFLVGDATAPPFTRPGRFPYGPGNRLTLTETRPVGDCVLLRYTATRPGHDHDRWMAFATALARRCPPSSSAYSVGAVIVGEAGDVLATGWSREGDPHDHAEEAALAKLPPDDPRLTKATLYTSLEPCTTRASRPHSCTDLILRAGIPSVVLAWREPPLFADCTGTETLREAGVHVTELPSHTPAARHPNTHLPTV